MLQICLYMYITYIKINIKYNYSQLIVIEFLRITRRLIYIVYPTVHSCES